MTRNPDQARAARRFRCWMVAMRCTWPLRWHAGEAAFIQRRQVYKRRNALDHFADEHKADVKEKLQDAYA